MSGVLVGVTCDADTPSGPCTRWSGHWYRHEVIRDDQRTGYATENVVPATDAEQDAMAAWLNAIHWATEDVA